MRERGIPVDSMGQDGAAGSVASGDRASSSRAGMRGRQAAVVRGVWALPERRPDMEWPAQKQVDAWPVSAGACVMLLAAKLDSFPTFLSAPTVRCVGLVCRE